MAIVYSYPTAPPESQDLLIGVEMAVQGGEGTPRTKTFTIGSVTQLAVAEAADSASELYATKLSPIFIGTATFDTDGVLLNTPVIFNNADVTGLTKTTVGLSDVDNTTDLLKPISTATQSALDLKADLAGATFTGDINALAFIKEDGLSTEYLMADGSTFTGGGEYAFPTLDQVTTAGPTTTNNITANSFIKTGGTGAEFLKANGDIDSNAYVPYTGAAANVDLGSTNTITANSFIKSGGTSVQYLMANGDTSTMPTLQQVTTAGAITTDSITANSFVKSGGSPTQYLMANGDTSAMPTLAQITAAGAITTSTITLNPSSGDGLVINAGAETGISSTVSTGNAIQVSSVEGNGLYASTTGEDGIAITATAINTGLAIKAECEGEGAALFVDGKSSAVGAVVFNGGVNISGLVNPTNGFQLKLSLDSAQKPNGGPWTGTSDLRVKQNISPYEKGLAEILLVNTVNFEYNGLADTESGIEYVGIIAQDIKDIFPETINTYKAKLNEEDEEKTELYSFNSGALTFALINAVKQLSAEIELLKSI